MELLKIEGLTKVIRKKKILDNISLNVNPGEIVGFLGPNGAGKTTTIKIIMGLFTITAGNVAICGHNIVSDFEAAMRNVGGIVENPDLYKRLTGRQNLRYFASMNDTAAENHIEEVISLVKMAQRIDDKVKTYSLGIRKRVGIAQALLHTHKLLELDEPTNGLDPIGIKELRDLLKYLSKNAGVGVFISSHLLSEMELMCDRIYIIDNGVIIGEKTIEQVQEQDDNEGIYNYTFATTDNERVLAYFKSLEANCGQENGNVTLVMKRSLIPDIVSTLVGMGIGLYAVNQQHRTLEQDFISMTTGTKTQIR